MGIYGTLKAEFYSAPFLGMDGGAASGGDIFKLYSGMCVRVSGEQSGPMFVAIFEVADDGTATLRQLSDYAPGSGQSGAAPIKGSIRGYSERDKKAVYIEANISPNGQDLWKADDLKLVKILNDRAFYRVDSNIDAIASSVALGENIARPCRMTNMSKGGANILSEEIYAVNDRITLTAKLRPDAPESTICCEIVRITEKKDGDTPKYEYGCRFTDLSKTDENHIAKNILQSQAEKRKK